MRYIVSVSGGLGSTEALKRTIETRGKENVAAVFADVKGHGSSHYWSVAPVVDELLDERGGVAKPMSLYAFIPRIEAGDYAKLDFGGCGCFVGQPTLFELPPIDK